MVQKFYFPLIVDTYEVDGWSVRRGNSIEANGRTAYRYRHDIESALDEYSAGVDMADYFHGSETAKAKIASAEWLFEAVGECLYGRVDVALSEPLSAEETKAVKRWIEGQNSDGLGEGFEQKRVDTRDGGIFISFWNPGDEYRIMTEAELKGGRQKEDDIMTPAELEKLVNIARENIPALEDRPDLEARDNDTDDFFETAVWSLKDALIAAYELGKATG